MAHRATDSRRYAYPVHRLFLPVLRVLFGVRSSISHDAALLLTGAHSTPRILNFENIPPVAPFILTLNHYDRPGLGTWWGVALVITAVARRRQAEPKDLRLAAASEWWYPAGLGRWFKQPLTKWFFGQVAKSYGLIQLPPVLANEEFRGQGTLGVRRALALTRTQPPQLLGLAPEGRTGENQTLCEPPSGAGLFLLMLSRGKIPCLPVGIYEDEQQTLYANFGMPYLLQASRALSRDERDRAAARQAMVEIGKLLPPRMWGVYHSEVAQRIAQTAMTPA